MNLTKIFSILVLCFICLQPAKAVWTKQNSGTLAWLHSVYFVDENRGWIAGSNGTLLATGDSGKSWKPEKKFTADNIRQVYFSDEAHGWLLCERDIYGAETLSPSYLMETSDAGATWQKINFTEGKERIARIFFSKSGAGFAVGEAGAFWTMTDDKETWKKTALPVRYLMLGGAFGDASHGALVGAGGTILFTEDAGLSWNPAQVAGNVKPKLNSIFFVNRRIGWTVGAGGKIYSTNNGGKFWREQNSTVNENLTDVFFLNTAEGFAVSDGGTILHTATAGNVWTLENADARHKLEKIFFVGGRGFAVGFGGTILVYDSGGSENLRKEQPRLQKGI